MTDPPPSILTDGERGRLASGDLDAEAHRSLDAAVGYRVRLLAARSGHVDPDRLVADVRLLEDQGHNATVSLVRGRLGEYLPPEDRD